MWHPSAKLSVARNRSRPITRIWPPHCRGRSRACWPLSTRRRHCAARSRTISRPSRARSPIARTSWKWWPSNSATRSPTITATGEWRAEVERLVETGQRILADRERYGDHLEGVPAGGERMEWALEEIRETLARDDKHLAEGRERERKSEQPEKREQTKKQARKTAKQKRKGRYQSRGLRM